MSIIAISGRIGSGKDTVGKIIQCIIYAEQTELYKKDTNFIKECFDIDNGDNIELTKASKVEIKKFADKLKDIVCLLINCTREQLEDTNFKNDELREEWFCYIFNNGKKEELTLDFDIARILSFDNRIISRKLTPRILLQLLGTECGRNIIHPNIWINSLMSEYKETLNAIQIPSKIGESVLNYPNWIITDMRFPNEFEAIKKRNGISIRVNKLKADCTCSVLTAENCKIKCNKSANIEHSSETALDNVRFDYTINNNGTIEELIEKVKEVLIKENIIN